MTERDRVQAHHTSGDGEVEDRDRPEPGSARDGGRLRRLSTPQWVLAPWPRFIRPAVVLVGAVYVLQYVREVIPGGPDDQLDPSSDPTLILNGFILAGLMVALMWPWRVERR